MDSTKIPNLETTHNHRHHRRHHQLRHHQLRHHHGTTTITTPLMSFKRAHEEEISGKVLSCEGVVIGETAAAAPAAAEQPVEESGRERLKRHRVEMSGRVWIPEMWGQEDLLNKWIDCTVFDSTLEKTSIMSAREALIQKAGRSTLSI